MPLLFSYGTLQDADVQRSLFGRLLRGRPDELVGFEQSLIEVEETGLDGTSGRATHAIVRFNGRDDSRVGGTAFEVTDSELASADEYEPVPYTRIATTLASGKAAWVYADVRSS